MLENIEKPYQCEHCRKWFSTIYVRNQHMTRCVLNYDGVEPAPIVQKKYEIYSGHGELFVKAVRDCKSLAKAQCSIVLFSISGFGS